MANKKDAPKRKGKPVCYVCGNVIRENALYIGNETYRHEVRCRPLSASYVKHFPKSLSAKLMEASTWQDR